MFSKHLVVLFLIGLLIACSQEMGEKDYYDLANQYMKKGNWQKAEETFETIVKKYPDGFYTARSIFMVAYLNANHLNNTEKAKQYYELFIQKYPNHELTDDARFELQHLGQKDLPFLDNSSSSNEPDNQSTTAQ